MSTIIFLIAQKMCVIVYQSHSDHHSPIVLACTVTFTRAFQQSHTIKYGFQNLVKVLTVCPVKNMHMGSKNIVQTDHGIVMFTVAVATYDYYTSDILLVINHVIVISHLNGFHNAFI